MSVEGKNHSIDHELNLQSARSRFRSRFLCWALSVEDRAVCNFLDTEGPAVACQAGEQRNAQQVPHGPHIKGTAQRSLLGKRRCESRSHICYCRSRLTGASRAKFTERSATMCKDRELHKSHRIGDLFDRSTSGKAITCLTFLS